MTITADQARSALHYLGEARDMALIFGTGGGSFSQSQLVEQFERAAKELGFALTPIPQAGPADGGRLSHNEPEPAFEEGEL